MARNWFAILLLPAMFCTLNATDIVSEAPVELVQKVYLNPHQIHLTADGIFVEGQNGDLESVNLLSTDDQGLFTFLSSNTIAPDKDGLLMLAPEYWRSVHWTMPDYVRRMQYPDA